MDNAQRFPYLSADTTIAAASPMPLLPFSISYHGQSASVLGLLDTGSSVNVLPYRTGIQLGAEWDENATSLQLSGNLARFEARSLIVSARVGHFDTVRLAFAWSKADHLPAILGQVNFFMEFDACFYRTKQIFEIHPK